ncbi:hypothetical protein [Lentzea sp. NPDC060358]|uniref:hypothetical protein n=1 Tax=Lentzea sp. NPDC060358 TaxID=3347103 RepID=UPI0036563F0A
MKRVRRTPTIVGDVEPDPAGTPPAQQVVRGPGAIILLHPGCASRDQTRQAPRPIGTTLEERGSRFVTASALLRLR